MVVFFKVNSNIKFYNLIKKETDDDNIVSIQDKAVIEYVIGRNFMLIPNLKENLKLKSINWIVYKNDKFLLKEIKDKEYKSMKYENDFEKMSIENFENILGEIVSKCTEFS